MVQDGVRKSVVSHVRISYEKEAERCVARQSHKFPRGTLFLYEVRRAVIDTVSPCVGS